MKLSITQAGRKRRVALVIGAAALVGGGVFASAAAADAASTPATKPAHHTTDQAPTLVAVNGAPDLSKVQPGHPTKANCDVAVSPAHPIKRVTGAGSVSPAHPIKPVDGKPVTVSPADPASVVVCSDDGTTTKSGSPTLVEVPGAKPDLSKVKIETPKAVGVAVQPVGSGTTTTR